MQSVDRHGGLIAIYTDRGRKRRRRKPVCAHKFRGGGLSVVRLVVVSGCTFFEI
ncbi:hypothetical protein WN51_11796 [Melipona quadrifasciata]|uniref:Uncharacterized protein n=1 Tax=Melipona quadrifasciata TaxID=166423 RepID=A0A0N0BHD1_9HYME|nr:hypothetical protein WN51_11796 [Melipona quadrifasciata]